MATVTVHYISEIAVDANARNTFAFLDARSGPSETRVIAATNTEDFVNNFEGVLAFVETDNLCRYEVTPGTTPLNAVTDSSPPMRAAPYELQGPIQLRKGWTLTIRADG